MVILSVLLIIAIAWYVLRIGSVNATLQDSYAQLERAFREKAEDLEKFRQTVDSATDGILITDPHGNIIYVNAAWERLNGYRFSEVRGKNPGFLRSEKTPREEYAQLWKSLRAGHTYETEAFVNRRKDGSEYAAQITFFPIVENGKTLFFAEMSQDISKRKEIDQAKSEFVSLASHQLRTPLTAVSWYAETLLNKKLRLTDNGRVTYLKEIYEANTRMIRLVDAFLNVSRLELGTFAIEPEELNVVGLLDDVLSELRPRIKQKRLQIRRKYARKRVMLAVDQNLTRIIFQNLLTNAIKYTHSGGNITLGVDRTDAVTFSVSDTGIGIPRANQPKIFTKLFRAENVQREYEDGTGLGLYIVKLILDYVGGTVRFESIEGKGTTFFVKFPKEGMGAKEGNKKLHT